MRSFCIFISAKNISSLYFMITRRLNKFLNYIIYFLDYDIVIKLTMPWLLCRNRVIYCKNSKIWDTSNNCHNCSKNRKVWCNIALMHPKDADGMANSVDPDQTASSEAVWSWSALFAETYLSQYIEFVLYVYNVCSDTPVPIVRITGLYHNKKYPCLTTGNIKYTHTCNIHFS